MVSNEREDMARQNLAYQQELARLKARVGKSISWNFFTEVDV